VSTLRERLAEELATKVERHGVVVWDDPEAAYSTVVDDVAPTGVTIHRFDGSWFDLRYRLEDSLAGQEPPTVVAYVPTKPSDPDPLEELRAFGARFRLTLPTLVKNALGGQLTEQRITQIGQQCSTIAEVEAALDAGDAGLDARLISVVGETSTAAIAAALIAGAHEAELAERNLADVVRRTLEDSIGGDFTGLGDEAFRHAAFRQVVLNGIADVVGQLPDELAASLSPSTPAQHKVAAAVVDRLRSRPEFRDCYVQLANAVDEQLHLGALLPWSEELRSVDLTPAVELLALTESFRLLEAGHDEAARDLASERLSSSWWLTPSAPGGDLLATKYRAVRALARLGLVLSRPVSSLASVAAMRTWYTDEGWQVDAAYRQSELVRVTSGLVIEELDELFHRARHQYEAWLDQVLLAAADAMAEPEVTQADLQRSIHNRVVRNGSQRTAYILVDALRYELGVDLVERLRILNADVEVTAAVGTPPSITPIGMAAVLPKADTDFRIDLGAKDRLEVSVGGNQIKSVNDRIRQLEHAHGTVVDLVLDDVAQCSNKELKKKLGATTFVLVRSTEIDADGESDQLAASWGSFDMTLNVLQTAVAKLLHAGIQRIVITADHGFLAVRQLGEDRRIDKPPTGSGELHRRAWIGRGGTASDSTLKVPLAAFGIAGDLDIITPRGLGVFASGGGLQFFHGGLSPQELIVPVIVVTAEDDTPDPQYQIDLAMAGGKITTGVVAVTVAMRGDLFTRESRIRLQLVQDRTRVGTVVGGDGFDSATETVDASVDAPRVITLQVTANLAAGSTATLEVLDAATGVRLAALDVDVATNILVDDDLH
jgi:hypothetical protein